MNISVVDSTVKMETHWSKFLVLAVDYDGSELLDFF